MGVLVGRKRSIRILRTRLSEEKKKKGSGSICTKRTQVKLVKSWVYTTKREELSRKKLSSTKKKMEAIANQPGSTAIPWESALKGKEKTPIPQETLAQVLESRPTGWDVYG